MSASLLPSAPGAYRLTLEIPSAGTITGVRLPHLLIVGAQPGPGTAITAGQHGREVAGPLSVALAFRALDPAQVRGVVHFFPALHPIALRLRQQDYPVEAGRYRKLAFGEEFNLDRLWGAGGAGAAEPLLSATTARVWEACLSGCAQLLDLHCWSEYFCPMAWAHERDAALLAATGFPWLTLRRESGGPSLHTLREKAWSEGKPIVVAELPGQNVAHPEATALGVRTIRNFLIACGQLDEPPQRPAQQVELREGGERVSVEAPATGLWHPALERGERVEAGDLLGEILGLETFEPVAKVFSSIPGLLLFNGPPIWGEDHREHQLIDAGQPLARVQRIHRILPV